MLTVVFLIALADAYGLFGIILAPPLAAACQILWNRMISHRTVSGAAAQVSDLRQDNPGNDMFYVNCAGCGREIEFGWAQPDRVGGIFPAECSDFNPKEIWPESRYLNSWHEKGWLRTETD
ncbi:MAG: hypothetical protein M5U34_09960 [Chloroflexi bacterium]|nr:hypothetical protein [Chloroflexota bacterium]